jgi:hypothetical protein
MRYSPGCFAQADLVFDIFCSSGAKAQDLVASSIGADEAAPFQSSLKNRPKNLAEIRHVVLLFLSTSLSHQGAGCYFGPR